MCNKHLHLYSLKGLKIHLKIDFGFGEALRKKCKPIAVFEVKEGEIVNKLSEPLT